MVYDEKERHWRMVLDENESRREVSKLYYMIIGVTYKQGRICNESMVDIMWKCHVMTERKWFGKSYRIMLSNIQRIIYDIGIREYGFILFDKY